MSDEIRVGDRFLVEVEVISGPVCTVTPCHKVKAVGQSDVWTAEESVLLAGKRLHRQLRVGDRVVDHICRYSGTIVAMHKDEAWVDEGGEAGCSTYNLADLTLVEESAS